MTPDQYQVLAERTICPQIKVPLRLEDNIQLLHASVGISGEAGELATAIEKWLWYKQELDTTNVLEELGDLLWYIAEACSAMGWSLDYVMRQNITKLQKRFPDKYTDRRAAEENRDRKAEREVLEQSTVETVQDEPLEQTGQGWAEPKLELERLRDSNNYDRVCEVCNYHKIHNSSKFPICPSCSGRTEYQEKIKRIKDAYSK